MKNKVKLGSLIFFVIIVFALVWAIVIYFFPIDSFRITEQKCENKTIGLEFPKEFKKVECPIHFNAFVKQCFESESYLVTYNNDNTYTAFPKSYYATNYTAFRIPKENKEYVCREAEIEEIIYADESCISHSPNQEFAILNCFTIITQDKLSKGWLNSNPYCICSKSQDKFLESLNWKNCVEWLCYDKYKVEVLK